MLTPRIILMLSVAIILGGCAATPKIQLSKSNMGMELKSKAPLVSGVDYSKDGKSVVSGAADHATRLWDVVGVKQVMLFKGDSIIGNVAFSPDGKIVSSEMMGDVTTFWDISTGKESRQIKGMAAFREGRISFSPDGRYILGLGEKSLLAEGTLTLWDVQSNSVVKKYKDHQFGQISPDGKYVVGCGFHTTFLGERDPKDGGFLSLFNIATGTEVWKEVGDNCGVVIFSPDVQRILIASNQLVGGFANADLVTSFKLFDTATGQQIKEIGRTKISGFFDPIYGRVSAIAFSPDGKSFLSGDLGGRYKLWDVATGTMVRQFKTVDEAEGTLMNTVPSIAFSPDGKIAVIASLASTRLYDVSTGDELATMIGFEDGEWLVTTPNGYYNSSEKGDQYLSVTVGDKPYTISQLRESFYRPDLVKVALAGQHIEGMRKIADIKPPPNVAIINTPASVSSDQITVSLEVKDQGGGIGDVRLYLNGTAVVLDQGTRALSLKAATPSSARTFSYPLQLISGKNSLRAIAFNADNTMQSTDALYEIDAKTAVKKPALHALVVGIQEYENPKLTLKYPVADANLFADSLKERAAGLFETIKITRLTTRQETTSASITVALNKMRAEVGPNDLFVFYVASHGTVDDGEYFLITSNVGATSTEKLKRDALSQNSLKELISNIPAAKKLIVLDTCNAGKLGDAIQVAMLTRGMSEDTAFKVLSRAVGSTILSAANSQQEALEGYRDHGLFTYVISEGLQGKADLDKDGFVKTTELANYIEDEVPDLAEKVFHHKQYPVASPSGQGFPVVRVR